MKSHTKILSIVGTRPEAIKMAPVIHQLSKQPWAEHRVILSGQHRELLHSALAIFDIGADQDLALMQENQSLSDLTARALVAFDKLYRHEAPDWVLVQGDTTTAMSAALAAFYARIHVAHVEAGLRTDDIYNPFPEEINRRYIDQVTSLHFAPTQRSRQNLLRDGIQPASIVVTGNTGIDALLQTVSRNGHAPVCLTPLLQHGLRIVLVTAHRRENFGQPLADICLALRRLVERNPQVAIVYAVHPNPNVHGPVKKALAGLDRILLTDALDYVSFVGVMKACDLILTDSGGLQEEAPSLGKPVLVLRETTERVEGIEAGTARLVGTEPKRIVQEVERLLFDAEAYARMAHAQNPYGDGHASERIVEYLSRRSHPEAMSSGAESPLHLSL